MKKLLFIPILLISLLGNAQRIPQSLVVLSTLTDLRAEIPQPKETVQLMGLSSATDGNGGFYGWISTSTATDDGFITVAVNGITTGRWVRLSNSNTIKGSKTLNGTLAQTAYPITFDTALPATPALIIIQAYSGNAAVPSWVSNASNTGFTANFSSVPVIGTNNITVGYLIIKQ